MADLVESEGPVVTGISPSVGLPETKVTIRGENLGESKDDVIGTKNLKLCPFMNLSVLLSML